MKIRVSNSLFVILVSAELWQPVSAAADSYDPPARVARLNYSRGSVSFQPAGDSEWVDAVLNLVPQGTVKARLARARPACWNHAR